MDVGCVCVHVRVRATVCYVRTQLVLSIPQTETVLALRGSGGLSLAAGGPRPLICVAIYDGFVHLGSPLSCTNVVVFFVLLCFTTLFNTF